MKRDCIVLGTRPEIIKLSPIILEYRKRNIQHIVVHTGQHYSQDMDEIFFDELNLPFPDYNLQCTAVPDMISSFSNLLRKIDVDRIIVLGDTNSTLAGSLVSNRHQIPLVHLEAGLRSFDIIMAEEVNRMIADHLSNDLFAPTSIARTNLVNENVSGNINVFGNTIVDVVERYALPAVNGSEYYALATLHRAENVDFEHRLNDIITALNKLKMRVLLPLHPRTKKRIEEFKCKLGVNIEVMQPVGYLKMMRLMNDAQVVITDSGGVQEEACILGTPCVTVRDNTERPETVSLGANVLVGTHPQAIVKGVELMLGNKNSWIHPYGSNVASQIVDELCRE